MQAAILPRLVGTAEQLTSANALAMIVEGLGAMAGPLIAGLLLAVASAGEAYVAAGVGILAGALLVGGVSARAEVVPGDAGPGDDDRAATPRLDLLAGIRVLRASPGATYLALLVGARQVAAGALDVLIVVAAIELLGMGESGAGFLDASNGLGAVIGGASTLALAGRARISPFLFLGAAAWCVFLLSIAVSPSANGALILLALAGVGLSVLEVTARTLLQRILPLEALTPAFGVLEGFVFGGIALGALIAGPLIGLLGIETTLGIFAVAMPIAAALVLPTVSRGERSAAVPFREIELLRALPLFAPLPAATIEQAARRLVPVTVARGETVIREGEIGDRFYVIAAGEVLVTKEGAELRRLGPGAGFGEIALIRAIPRTASVAATAPTELLALERDDFLLAVMRTPAALAEAHRVVDGHLERDRAGGPAGR
jgi:MFS family permease